VITWKALGPGVPGVAPGTPGARPLAMITEYFWAQLTVIFRDHPYSAIIECPGLGRLEVGRLPASQPTPPYADPLTGLTAARLSCAG
jgi:hypothetical protein